MNKKLISDRVQLRPLSVEDAPCVQSIVADKRISDMVSNIPYPYPEDGAVTWILDCQQKIAQGKRAAFLVVLKDCDELIGAISLNMGPEEGEAELGYWLGVDYWGKGYATEAAKLMMMHGFEHLKLKRIHARHLTINPNSGKVLRKAGMTHTHSQEGTCGDKVGSIEYYELPVESFVSCQS